MLHVFSIKITDIVLHVRLSHFK